MKKLILICLSLFTIVNFVFAQDIIEKEFQVKMGEKLDLELRASASVEIEGWDEEVVSVNVDLGRVDPRDYTVDFDQTGTIVRIYTYDRWEDHNYRNNVRFDIKVPNKFNIDIDVRSGDVNIRNVEGKLRGKTMNGDLNLYDLNGDIRFKSMNGELELSGLKGEIRLETMNGDVNLADSEAEGSIETMNGKIRVTDAPAGAKVHTMNGDIFVRSAKKYIEAETMNGDVEINAIDGMVEASTMNGDLEVTMVGDPSKGIRDVDISTSNGMITLTLPANLSMQIDVELENSGGRRGYKIVSDFDLKIEEEEGGRGRRDRWGSPGRYIYGTGTFGDGKNRIRIKGVDGDIYIRKGR